MKTRLVVGPPPLKYVDRLKTYSKGGTLPTRSNPLTVKGDPWEYAQENGVIFTRKKGSNKWIDLGSSDSMSKLSSINQTARKAILDKYGSKLNVSNTPTKTSVSTTVKPEPVKKEILSEDKLPTLKPNLSDRPKPTVNLLNKPRQTYNTDTLPTRSGSISFNKPKEKVSVSIPVKRETFNTTQLPKNKPSSVVSTTPVSKEKLKVAKPLPKPVAEIKPTVEVKPATETKTVVKNDDEWIKTIMQFEATKGSKEGKGLSNFGYNSSKAAPKNIDEAVELYKKEYLPKVSNLPEGVRERFGDFLYNSGENLWLYMTHLHRLNKGGEGVQDRSKYRVKGGQEGQPGERYQYLEQDFAKDISEISKLPTEEQVKLADKARDWYYKNINTVNGKPSSTYENSWKYRVNMFNTPEKKQYGGKLPKYANGSSLNTASNIVKGVGGLASMIPGIGGIIGSAVSGVGGTVLDMLAQQQANKSSFNKMYSSTPMMQKGGKIKSDPPGITGKQMYQSLPANIAKFFDPTGLSSWPDVAWAIDEYKKGNTSAGNLALEAFGALPLIGKAKPLIYVGKNASKISRYGKTVLDVISKAGDMAGDIERTPLKLMQDWTSISKKPAAKLLNATAGNILKSADEMQGLMSKGINKTLGISNKAGQTSLVGKKEVVDAATRGLNVLNMSSDTKAIIDKKEKGGLIKRKDGSYSRRGLWDNIRANRGSGKKPTKQMLEQERKIKSKMEYGGMLTGKDDLSFYKGRSHANGGILVSQKGTPSKKAIAEVEGNETRYQRKNDTYIFSDKLVI